jgi:hypothetical protein
MLAFGMTSGYAAPMIKPQPPIERQGQRGSWQYRAAIDRAEGRILADVTYALETVAQVEDFARTQRQLASELVSTNVSSLDATIVFHHPLTQSAFEQFVVTHNLTVSSYTLRFVDNQGQRITIVGSPADNVLVPQDSLNFALADIQQRSPGALLGWVEVRATIPARAYESIVSNDKVYLIDVSRSVVRAAFNGDPKAHDLPIDVLAPQIYWKLENLRLVSN